MSTPGPTSSPGIRNLDSGEGIAADERSEPPAIQEEVDALQSATGLTPQVFKVRDRRWRLTLATERVRMTVDFKLTSRGRAQWAASTLEVDGKPRPLARDEHELARIMRDPDAPVVAEPMLPPVAVSEAPPKIRHLYQVLTGRLGDAATVELGGHSRVWMIGLQTGEAVLRLRFTPGRGSSWAQTIQVVIDGVDRSREVENDLDRALALMAGVPPEPTANPAPVSSAAGSKRSNSVEVRRATVIRV